MAQRYKIFFYFVRLLPVIFSNLGKFKKLIFILDNIRTDNLSIKSGM